jgi:hypothetical protein
MRSHKRPTAEKHRRPVFATHWAQTPRRQIGVRVRSSVPSDIKFEVHHDIAVQASARRELPPNNGMQSDVEGLRSNYRCTVWLQHFQAQRTRRRPSTPLMPGPLGGANGAFRETLAVC